MKDHSYLPRWCEIWAGRRQALWQACETYALRAPGQFSLLAVLALLTAAMAVLHIAYASIDDVLMTMIVSGTGMCSAPDAHLLFTNIFLGAALKQLYLAAPSIPWYGVYLVLVHTLAQTALLYCALTIGRPIASGQADESWAATRFGLRLDLYLLCFVLVEMPLLNRLQFTTTAFLAAVAGIFLWLLAWQRRSTQPQASVASVLLAAILLLVLGGAIRWESLVMAVLVATPAGMLFVWRPTWAAIVPCGTAAIVTAGILAAAVGFDHWAYEHDPAWRGFREQHQSRRIFHDLHWTEYNAETAHVFSQVGWSENDHAMIERWFVDDPVVYSEANLRTIAEATDWNAARMTPGLWWQAFRDTVRHRAVLSILLVLPFVLAAVPGKHARVAIVATMLVAIEIVVLVTWLQKLPPERVFFPLMSSPLLVALLSLAWRNEPVRPRTAPAARQASGYSFLRPATWPIGWQWRSTVVGLVVVAVVMSLLHQLRQSTKIERGRTALHRFLDELQLDQQKLYVAWESALPLELISPWDNLGSWSGIRVLSLAWPTGTPWYEETKRDFGITNLARALVERDDIVIVAWPAHLELFTRFAREHFGESIEFVTSRQVGKLYVAGNFQSAGAAINAAAKPLGAAPR